MSVIIRLQNLPWSANALDIRQFFKGLSIPEGGVHIVGGEMGDAFIAFSTDEDARQAMMHDREKINEVQVRLLLSSRAEMQKVIETARQLSLLALQNAGAIAAVAPAPPKITTIPLSAPQPPVITTNSLQNILSNKLVNTTPTFLAYQQQAGITLDKLHNDATESLANSTRRSSNESSSRDKRRSNSRERRRSRSRDRSDRSSLSKQRRREKSRSRSRDRDWGKGRRSSRRSRSRERSHDRNRERSRERSHERSNRNSNRSNAGNYSSKDAGRGSSRDGYSKSNGSRGSSTLSDAHDHTLPKPKAPVVSPWSIPPTNAYQANYSPLDTSLTNSPNQYNTTGGGNSSQNVYNAVAKPSTHSVLPNPVIPNAYSSMIGKSTPLTPNVVNASSTAPAATIIPAFQSYSTTTSTTNNYSINLLGSSNSSSSDSIKPFALQNPYTAAIQASNLNSNSQDSNMAASALSSAAAPQNNTMFPGLFLDKKPEVTQNAPQVNAALAPVNVQQEPIAFASTNPYAQMYPNLFAQAAAIGTITKPNVQQPSTLAQDQQAKNKNERYHNDENLAESCSIRISNMCSSTTYSDLRKFFAGLFIPHNGIKMINDKNGIRVGTAFIQFSRSSSVQKAMVRNNTMLKSQQIKLEIVADKEFENTEDSFRPQNRFDRPWKSDYGNRNDSSDGGNWSGDANNSGGGNSMEGNQSGSTPRSVNSFNHERLKSHEPFSVLFIEDIPSLATEQDIMKMFSSFTIFDILLTSSPENRRQFIAHVLFSRDEEAKAAFEDKSRHVIGYRKVRVRPGTVEQMERAKEKLRLANEQLKKEELAMEEEETRLEEERLKQQQQQETSDKENAEDNDDGDITMENTAEHDDGSRRVGNDDAGQDFSSLQGNINNKDPRNPSIPSLFDLSPPKPDDVTFSTDDGPPSDPRLRRQRPTRFESNQQQQDNSNNNNNNNSNNNNNNNNNMMMPQQFMNTNFNANPPIDMNSYPMNNIHNSNSTENNFIVLKNCDYNTRINEVAELFMSANLRLKHVELLRNDRRMPTGEFIVEFQNQGDAENAVTEFNNTKFRMRNLRIRMITPQEIADRLGKPFLNYYPGGRGHNGPGPGSGPGPMQGNFDFTAGRGGTSGGSNNMMNSFRGMGNMRFSGDGGGGGNGGGNNNMPMFGGPRGGGGNGGPPMHGNGGMRRGGVGNGMGRSGGIGMASKQFNDHSINIPDNDDITNQDNDDVIHINDDDSSTQNETDVNDDDCIATDDGIPAKFNKPGCVVSMENVPFKADLKDIMQFFNDFELTPDDIIRRFNDDGSATGDARVAFKTPAIARAAFDAKKRKHIFNRTVYLNIL